MSTLVLVRHGQASLGTARYDQLSPLGLQQAVATGRTLAERWPAPTRVWVGPRARHQATWAGVATAWRSPVIAQHAEALDELAEAEQLGAPGDRATYLNAIERWARGALAIEGVASVEAFRARAVAWLESATADSAHGQQVLAVTSAGVIAMVTVHLLGLPTSSVMPLISVMRNASLTEVVFSARGRAIVSFNSASHLPSTLLSSM
jgi:broad specificity phosphatase PhoE